MRGWRVGPRASHIPVRCNPLAHMLDRVGRKHVDFWSLDVEGHELPVLKGVNWEEITVDVLVVETNHFSAVQKQEITDFLSGRPNMERIAEMAIDTVYVRRGSGVAPDIFDTRVFQGKHSAHMRKSVWGHWEFPEVWYRGRPVNETACPAWRERMCDFV